MMLAIADVLYHATYPDAEDAIYERGLLPGVNGSVSLCVSPAHAAGFINMFGCSRITAMQQIPNWNRSIKVPYDTMLSDDFDEILVIGVKVSMLDDRDFVMNMYDKSQAVTGVLPEFVQSYDHSGPIPVDALIEQHWFKKDDRRIHPLFRYTHKRKHIR